MKRILWLVPGVVGVLLVLVAPGRSQGPSEEGKQLLQKALELAKDKKAEEALALAQKALALQPKNDLFLAYASQFARQAGRYAEGLDYIQKALEINNKNGVYHVLAAVHAYGTQDLDRAHEYAKKALAFSEAELGGNGSDARLIYDLTSEKTYTIYWSLDPQKALYKGTGAILIALPTGNLPYQTVSYEVTGARSHKLVRTEANDMLQVVPQGLKPFQVITKVKVYPYSYKKRLAGASKGKTPAEVQTYLGMSETINPKSQVLAKVVAELKGDSPAATVANILAWMKKNITYKDSTGPSTQLDYKSVDEIVERGHAECLGYATLFTALCRAAKVPARHVWGLKKLPASPESKGAFASHNWAEFYQPGIGWIPVDPQYPESLGCLPISCVRTFMDMRRSKATQENLPLHTLLRMNGDVVKFDEAR
jgi:tetratricopeptide (TPR) repeat protein